MRLTTCAFALVLAALAGCETGGISILATLTGRKVTIDIPEAAAAAADSEVTIGWDRIVVGVRPHNRTVGYLETRAFTPAGSHDLLQIAYIWPHTLDKPWGFVTQNGSTYRFRVDESDPDSDFMGRMPIESACLNVLGVCPKCGHQYDREVLQNVARVDLDPARARDFRHHAVDYHRRSRDLHPSEGTGLHAERGGGVNLDHACEECASERVEPLIGNVHSLRVQFEELTAADIAPKPALPAPAPAPSKDADASDEG